MDRGNSPDMCSTSPTARAFSAPGDRAQVGAIPEVASHNPKALPVPPETLSASLTWPQPTVPRLLSAEGDVSSLSHHPGLTVTGGAPASSTRWAKVRPYPVRGPVVRARDNITTRSSPSSAWFCTDLRHPSGSSKAVWLHQGAADHHHPRCVPMCRLWARA